MLIRFGALCFLLLAACDRGPKPQSRLTTASAAGSAQLLDGMQLESARRVAREQAKEAMNARDAQRLQQLRKWVEGRASVPILPPEDLAALDAVIGCLEQAADASDQLERAKTSQLADPARRACQR